VTVEILSFRGCPHAESVREMVRRCAADLGIEVALVELEGDYPSPTVRIAGRDIMGEPAAAERACRLDLPTEAHISAALAGAKP
jgi:hypothetical protein